MTNTPIRQLMEMLQTAEERNDAVLTTPHEWTRDSDSRIWSRQLNGLMAAIVAEPPQDIFEVLAVLEVLHSITQAEFDEIELARDSAGAEVKLNVLSETVHIALCNVIARLGHVVEMDYDKGPSINRVEIDFYPNQMKRWLRVPDPLAPTVGLGEAA